MSTINIIKASNEQLSMVAELFDQYRQFYKNPADLQNATGFIKERLERQDSTIFLATVTETSATDIKTDQNTSQNKPCGFVQLYPCFSSTKMKKMYILNDLFVHPSYRKLSVATALMDAAKDFATQNNAHSLKLCTAIDNHQAQALYKKLNYKKIESFDHYQLLL